MVDITQTVQTVNMEKDSEGYTDETRPKDYGGIRNPGIVEKVGEDSGTSPSEAAEYVESTPAGELQEDLATGDAELTGRIEKNARDTLSPLNTAVSGPVGAAVNKVHYHRSEKAREMDDEQAAPVTTDEQKWAQAPDEYDYPGADTIDPGLISKRAREFAARAKGRTVDKVQYKGSAKNLQGKFAPAENDTYGAGEDIVRVQKTAEEPGSTLAHEIGHTVDLEMGEMEEHSTMFGGTKEVRNFASKQAAKGMAAPDTKPFAKFHDDDEWDNQVWAEAREMSRWMRGDFDIGAGKQSYREGHKSGPMEIFADAIAATQIAPDVADRDAPEWSAWLENKADEEGVSDIFNGDADPLNLGF